MSIGSTIKRMRREKDITQEQLAEYLGITSRAVSQWECDRTTPDISQIPTLCHIFDVSSDILLGIDIEKNNDEIKKYLNEAKELGNQGQKEKRTALLREANKKFPRDYKIMHQLANSLVCEYSRKGIKEYDKVFELCNRILAECTDSNTRYEAMDTLALAYGYAGKQEEMMKLAKEMPRMEFSYENFMVYRWKGNDAFNERQDYMYSLINELFSMISCLSGHYNDEGNFIFSREERKELRRLELELLETFFPDGDYRYFATYGAMACSFLTSDALGAHDDEAIWYWLDKGADFSIHFDTYNFDGVHTSPILRGYSSGGWIMEACGNVSQSMLDWLTKNDETEVLRSDARYEPLIARLKKVAKKP